MSVTFNLSSNNFVSMESFLNKFKNIFKTQSQLKNKSHAAAIKLGKESNDLNYKVEKYLQNAKIIDEKWKDKWLK